MAKELLYLSVRKSILSYIQEQHLVAGDQLPNEQELQQLLNVGRNTLRKAIQILSQENIIRTVRGSGIFLTQMPVLMKEFTNQLQSVTHLMSEKDISIYYTVLQFSKVKRPLFLADTFFLDKEFHYIERLRTDKQGHIFAYEKSWIPTRLFPKASANDFSSSKFSYIEQHSKKIKNLVENYLPIISTSALEDILKLSKRSALMKSTGILSAIDNEILEYTEVYYNPSFYRFISTGVTIY